MTQIVTAVLIDTMSIQNYIFSSNRLKDNLGASYIVEYKLKQYLKAVLLDKFENVSDVEGWKENAQILRITTDEACNAEIAYIGGGKSMLFFRNIELAKEFIQAYSLKILLDFPGLRLAFGLLENYDLNGFQNAQKALTQKLIENKNQSFRNVDIPKHGITADCPRSNEVVEYSTRSDDGLEFISKTSYVKENYGTVAHLELNKKQQWRDILGDHFIFTNQLDDLGLPDQGRYMALVHVDGNSMGNQFNSCSNLGDLRGLSRKVSITAQVAMKTLIKEVVDLFTAESGKLCKDGIIQEEFQLKKISAEDKKQFPNANWYLPIRPIITAGDDITFVCEGRLGVYLAERLVAILESSDFPIKSCAGIAIVKAKYPFARAYHLVEELTLAAKSKSKKQDGACYLDFIIFSSGFSGSLEYIRQHQFKNEDGCELHFGPYRLDKKDCEDSIELLHKRLNDFFNQKEWSKSKIMTLREALFQDISRQDLFLQKAQADGLYKENEKLFLNHISLDFEAIELLDFYPKMLLK